MENIDPVGFGIFAIMVIAIVGSGVLKIYRKIFPYKATLNDVIVLYNREKTRIEENKKIDGYPKEWIEYDEKRLDIDKAKRQLTFIKPETKTHHVFHGGCLSCVTPLNKGIGECRKCCNFVYDWDMKNMCTR